MSRENKHINKKISRYDCVKHHSDCCSHSAGNFPDCSEVVNKKSLFEISRRDFLLGLGAVPIAGWALTSKAPAQTNPTMEPTPATSFRIGSSLTVKPVLVYHIPQRKEATSWRNWGGLHSKNDVANEANRIRSELKEMSSKADFPIKVLSIAAVDNPAEIVAASQADSDVLLVYAYSAGRERYEKLADSGKPNIIFVRHKSGPVYRQYETIHPIFLRKSTDEYKQPGVDIWDVVVDDYGEILWRLRALYGLKNTIGTRILAIGGPAGWGPMGYKLGPENAKKIWKLDIKTISYQQFQPMIKQIRTDPKAVQQANQQADEYLAGKGISLHTDRKAVVNNFLLAILLKQLMEQVDAVAVTVNGCMTTIVPMAQTPPCLAFSIINDEGLMAFCESDFVVIPSGILLRYISGKPVFLCNPNYPHKGITTCAHCTAPRRMNGVDYEPAKILTHFESDFGAAPKVQFTKNQVITCLVPSFSSEKWLGYKAKILDHPFYDICRSQMDLQIEGDWRKLLRCMQGFHNMICYGDYLREVGYALKKVGIKWENISSEEFA